MDCLYDCLKVLFNVRSAAILLVLWLLYKYYTRAHSYFKDKNIPYIKPKIIFGNLAPRVFLKLSFHDFNIKLYNHFRNQPYGGFFEGMRPALIIRSPDLIKVITIKDFDCFTDRNTLDSIQPPAISKMLLSIKGKEWKKVRTALTPAFSSGKLHAMGIFFQECSQQLINFLNNRIEENSEIEMKEFMGRYTLEVIGSCAFGLDCASLKDPNAEFVKIAANFNKIHLLRRLFFFVVLMFCPNLIKYTSITFFNDEVLKHLENVVENTKEDRKKSRRNDFMQLMLDIAEKEIASNEENVMTDDVIKAQAVLFLVAGFETTSTLLSFCCSALCQYPDIQEKLRKDIMNTLSLNKGECNYEVVNEIPMLEKVLLETLRMYPPVSRVDRVCTKPCTLPDTDIQVNIGDIMVIPIAGIMHDPEHYPEPHVFDPERFSAEEKMKRPPHLFLPFGMGPRNCIGMRFAMMSAKYCLLHIIKNFKLTPCSKTQYPITYDKRGIFLKAEKGNWVRVERL